MKILILGVTGFIGGTVLAEVMDSTEPELSGAAVTVLLRRQSPESDTARETILRNHYTTNSGSIASFDVAFFSGLEATDELEIIARGFDIIINTAEACDNLPAAEAIIRGLEARSAASTETTSPAVPVLIHCSGTGVIMDTALGEPDAHDTEIYSDADSLKIAALPPTNVHRDVDLCVAAANNKNIKTVTVVPPLVYGLGRGLFKRHSVQIPGFVTRCLALTPHRVEYIGRGLSKWSNVHVRDIAHAFVVVLCRVVRELTALDGGYYFAEAGENTWKDVAEGVARAVGKVVGQEVGCVSLTDEEVRERFPGVLRRHYDSSNSRSRAVKIRELGWKPVFSWKTPLLDDLEREVLYQIDLAKSLAA
ncbi:hypothetical protein HK100_008615 [Physocladia obscura]|uniref:NAD-dependent epimerase/dehydratase domain-containing protein n=1 Tax=Physocladia obscura TaxID=109957 RepID=A0AAD5XEJ4_9FUNG|nr:hypothetical protein HK100_008615 [Physocladia obscura]